METFLAFSSFSSLRTYLNVILIGIVVFIAMNKFSYLVNVIVYAVARTLIPMIVLLLLNAIIGSASSVSMGSIFLSLIVFFILGFPVIKIIEKITDYFNLDNILYFTISFAIIDTLVSLGALLILNLIF